MGSTNLVMDICWYAFRWNWLYNWWRVYHLFSTKLQSHCFNTLFLKTAKVAVWYVVRDQYGERSEVSIMTCNCVLWTYILNPLLLPKRGSVCLCVWYASRGFWPLPAAQFLRDENHLAPCNEQGVGASHHHGRWLKPHMLSWWWNLLVGSHAHNHWLSEAICRQMCLKTTFQSFI